MEENSVFFVDDTTTSEIYTIRGFKVMLDFDLAEIYGYTTSAFNQQVNRNISKFEEDFRFKLSRSELEQLSISQKVTSIQTKGKKGGRSIDIYAFTESGIYMLMTVLKGDLAVKQSKALIRTLKWISSGVWVCPMTDLLFLITEQRKRDCSIADRHQRTLGTESQRYQSSVILISRHCSTVGFQ